MWSQAAKEILRDSSMVSLGAQGCVYCTRQHHCRGDINMYTFFVQCLVVLLSQSQGQPTGGLLHLKSHEVYCAGFSSPRRVPAHSGGRGRARTRAAPGDTNPSVIGVVRQFQSLWGTFFSWSTGCASLGQAHRVVKVTGSSCRSDQESSCFMQQVIN